MEQQPKQKDYKKHYQTFSEKNKDKIHEVIKCPLCNGHYTYFNKSRHMKSTKHKNCLEDKKEDNIN